MLKTCIMNKIISLFIFSILLFSCSETKKENVVNQSEIENTENKVASYKSIEVDIKGMTCEIGCARTIESKLSKVDGISYSKVDFESGKGQFTFDENKLSENDIISKINGIAGGDLYSVTNTKPLLEIPKDSISS
jgi:mercuric ion binding protein